MAQCVQSVQEFIQDSFVPMVAVLCSEDAERVTRKNNLTFPELLRPFCRLTSEGKNPAEQTTADHTSQLLITREDGCYTYTLTGCVLYTHILHFDKT